jgi:hypothetical protein
LLEADQRSIPEAEFQKRAEEIHEKKKQKTPTITKLFEPAD